MEKSQLQELTDEELLVKKKELKKAEITSAVYIGFLAGILIFGFASWSMSEDKQIGFLIPMLIPILFISRLLKAGKKNQPLKEVLKERNLS